MTAALRVMVADDDARMREYLQEVLPRLGHEVIGVAENGRQLAELCRAASRPDLIIADVKMPEVDGIDAAAQVAQQQGGPVPVILVSGHHDDALLYRLSTGAVMAYLIKPITQAHLKAAIAVATQRFRQFQALSKEASDLRQALDDRKLIERAKGVLMRRLGADEEESFRRLRMLASSQNLKLVEVARRVMGAEEVFAELDRA